MSTSLRKKLTDQKKRWASYPAQLRTGQNAHICWKIKCFDILKKNVNEFTQKVDGPKKKMGTLSCSVKNRTECPYLLKNKMFDILKKMSMGLYKKLTDQKKSWASYPALLRTRQNAHIWWRWNVLKCWKKSQCMRNQKKFGTLSCWVGKLTLVKDKMLQNV